MYLDLTQMPDDLMGTLKLVSDAEVSFMSLPALVRKEFDNDPVQFVEYAADPTHEDQLRAWGLLKPQETPPAPMRVEVVNPPAAPPEPPKAPPGA
uniref:hypothetical protein n=1 Tax=Staphylococcus aureus TaxID=1280 RepID=UPI001C2E984D